MGASLFRCGRTMLLGFLLASHGAWASQLMLVVPARQLPVKMGQDMVRLRPGTVELVSYGSGRVSDALRLHAWDSRSRDWVPLSEDEFAQGAFMRILPTRALLLGTQADGVDDVAGAIDWTQKVDTQTSLAITDVLQRLDTLLSFSSAEWLWLAKRYDLKLRDRNERRRRYGRYGAPGEMPARPSHRVQAPFTERLPEPVVGELEIVKPDPLPRTTPAAELEDRLPRELDVSESPEETTIPKATPPVVDPWAAAEADPSSLVSERITDPDVTLTAPVTK